MTSRIKQALRTITLLAIIALGSLCVLRSSGHAWAEVYVLGLTLCGALGLALGEIREPTEDQGSQTDKAGSQRARDHQIDSVLSYIAKLIQSHLDDSWRYSDSLSHASRDLPLLENPEEIRSVVLMLIDENQKVQSRMNDLSRNLDESRSQIVQLRSNLAEAKEMGMRDPLTSLGNRRFFDASLATEIAEAQHERGDLCLVIGDLDNFKRINDEFGHPVGDTVLKLFGEILSKNTKGHDTVARLGGEEFAIVFPRTRLADAARVTNQIRAALETKRWVIGASGEPIGSVTASFGVAQLRRGEGADDLIRRADLKLYEAKSRGRNCVVVDPESNETALVA